jgi:hypothetical protein
LQDKFWNQGTQKWRTSTTQWWTITLSNTTCLNASTSSFYTAKDTLSQDFDGFSINSMTTWDARWKQESKAYANHLRSSNTHQRFANVACCYNTGAPDSRTILTNPAHLPNDPRRDSWLRTGIRTTTTRPRPNPQRHRRYSNWLRKKQDHCDTSFRQN